MGELIDPLGLPYNGFCDFQIPWRSFLGFFPIELYKSHSVSFVKNIAVGYFKSNMINEEMYYFMELSVTRLDS